MIYNPIFTKSENDGKREAFYLKNVSCFLLVKESGRDLDVDGIKVRKAAQWLQNLEA